MRAKQFKGEQLCCIEFDREIYALACANMLIHKDGMTNLAHMDARTESGSQWMKTTRATKILMNPPYESKLGCMKNVENVLNSVDRGTLCGFILPDKKLEKTSKTQMSRILRRHRLLQVAKLPENLFFGVGGDHKYLHIRSKQARGRKSSPQPTSQKTASWPSKQKPSRRT